MEEKHELKRVIGTKSLMFLTIVMLLGTEIYFMPSVAAEFYGPASLITWVFTAVIAVIISTYFAELVSMFPKSGGVYEFARNTFGEFNSFVVGWMAWIAANITTAMLIVGGLHYIIPNESLETYIPITIVITLLFSYVSYRGMKQSMTMVTVFALVTFAAISLVTAMGLVNIDMANLSPFFTAPWPMALIAIFFISQTFFGWEGITFFAEETKEPEKTIPKAMVRSTVIMGAISILLTFACLASVNWATLANSKDPMVHIAETLAGGPWGAIVAVSIFVAIIGAAAGWIISTPRLLMALSREKLFIKGFDSIHPKHKTPYKAIAFQCMVTAIIAAITFGSYRLILTMLVPLSLVMYSVVMVCVIKQRKKGTKSFYKSPFGVPGAVALIALYVALLIAWVFYVNMALPIVALGAGLIFSGVPAYFLVKMQDKHFVEKFFNRFSILYDRTQPIWYGVGERQKLISGLRASRGHKVLDYGCATCSNTMELAGIVGRNGRVVAVDLAINQLKRGVKKVENLRETPHVIFVKEEGGRAPFRSATFDSIVSVGVLGYQLDPEALLEYFHNVLKKNGRISLLDFGKSFIFPAMEHLKNRDKVKAMFERAGFRKVHIEEKRKLFTVYYYITATK